MIVTPFGELRFGDQVSLDAWKMAHYLRHLIYVKQSFATGQVLWINNSSQVVQWQNNALQIVLWITGVTTSSAQTVQSIDLTGPLNDQFFGIHALEHQRLQRSNPTPGSSLSALALEHGWTSESEFYDWHRMHDLIHIRLDQVFQVVAA